MHTSSHALARLLGDWSTGPGPAHRRLADLIRLLILDGRLPLATTMPGERDLAAVLGISRTTVSTAYAALHEQGYLSARARSRSRTRVPPGAGSQPEPGATGRDLIDFSHAAPPAPGEALHRAYRRALDQLPRHLPRHGYSQLGLAELRTAIARRYADRGLATTPDQILITNGAQHALGLIARTLLRPRSRVVVDHPTYPHALQVFRSAGCRIVPVPVTDTGWDVDSLSAATRGATMAYLLPDFHNPTGLCLPERDRAELRLGCPVVVDETMAELALDVDPPVPLAAHHAGVISIGSAAKTFWGGLRVGWVRTDADLVQQLGQARAGTDLGTPVVEQLACVELLGEIDRLLPDRLADLRLRRALLLDLLAERLPDWTITPSAGGLSVWARLPQPTSSALAAVAPQFGVRLAAGPRFGIGGAFERFVRLPYSLDAAEMTAGIDGIAEALAAVRAGRRADTPPAALA
ncbi:PLP-dependent aminotransferase family protein [Saccharopolyspora sp. NPDC050389]|uniref:MocR-like transcription factor YczR n=1 Tax=Saccharopolyspora sp. NPDC050389 TaxID=3155516 RepID=UPI0033D20C55